MCAITNQIDTNLLHKYGKNKNMHSSSNYPPKLLFITQEMDLGENLLQNPKSQRMEMMEQERERERVRNQVA
jgi:hypothetical protein